MSGLHSLVYVFAGLSDRYREHANSVNVAANRCGHHVTGRAAVLPSTAAFSMQVNGVKIRFLFLLSLDHIASPGPCVKQAVRNSSCAPHS